MEIFADEIKLKKPAPRQKPLTCKQRAIALELEVQMLNTQLNAVYEAIEELAEENEKLRYNLSADNGLHNPPS